MFWGRGTSAVCGTSHRLSSISEFVIASGKFAALLAIGEVHLRSSQTTGALARRRRENAVKLSGARSPTTSSGVFGGGDNVLWNPKKAGFRWVSLERFPLVFSL